MRQRINYFYSSAFPSIYDILSLQYKQANKNMICNSYFIIAE